jgi:YD repeat-containing protein
VKIRFQKTALTIGLVVSFSLVSCQKDSSIMPVEPVNTPAKASDDLIVSPGVPKKHTLTKFGKSNLTYYADGRLRSVTEGSAYNREYTYSGNTITAISYSNGQMAFKDTYLIDPATGRCFESTEVNYFVLKVPGNTQHFPTETRTWAFKYNNQGQLISCGIKNNPATRTDYTYNSQGDLVLATAYLEGQAENAGDAWYKIALTYIQKPTRQSGNQLTPIEYVDDVYPTNFNWLLLPIPFDVIDFASQPLSERYLRIFGKPSNHLLASANWFFDGLSYYNSVRYTYTLDADGYVTERKRFDGKNTTQLLEISPYEYKVTELGLSF